MSRAESPPILLPMPCIALPTTPMHDAHPERSKRAELREMTPSIAAGLSPAGPAAAYLQKAQAVRCRERRGLIELVCTAIGLQRGLT